MRRTVKVPPLSHPHVTAPQNKANHAPQKYGHLDVLIYNPGAIWWAAVEDTPMKRFQLMQRVNIEGLYGAVQASLPHLKESSVGGGGRIIIVSPPIYSRFFRGKTSYAMGKVGMSVLTKGLAMDFERQGRSSMAVTSIWPAAVSLVFYAPSEQLLCAPNLSV